MKRLGKFALFLVPIAIFVIACFKAYGAPLEYWPFPELPDDDRLLRHRAQILVALAGLFAPLPLCMAAALGLRKKREGTDEVGLLMAQLFVLVAIELSVFFGLVALGAVNAGTFLAAHGAIALAGFVILRRVDGNRTADTPGEGSFAPQSIRRHLLIVLALVSCGLASVHMGKDTGYDFYNYHHYNAYSFLNSRGKLDFALADITTFLNPMLDVAYYLVFESVRPIWAGFVIGAAHGVAVVLLYGIAYEVFGQTGLLRKGRAPLALACAVAGFCEPLVLGQLGTTFHDVMLVSFVLTALLLVLRLFNRDRNVGARWAAAFAVLAGASIGMATGFKLTSATYAVALGTALLATPIGWRRRLGLATAFGAGAFAGFLASNGWWMASLYANYGSPLFPVYNELFKSPYYPEKNISYLHQTSNLHLKDHLLIPFKLIRKSKLLSETPTSDLRLAVAYFLLILAVVDRFIALIRADWRSPDRLRRAFSGPLTPGAILLIGFAVVSYVIWYLQFRILRYLVALKVVLPLVCVLLLLDLCRSGRRVWVASALVLVLFTASFDVPNWGRSRWKKRDYLGYDVPKIEAREGGIVLLNASKEGGFLNGIAAVTTKLPPKMRYVRIDSELIRNPFGGKPLAMEQEVLQLLRTQQGPFFLLTHRDPGALVLASKLMKRYDLAISDGQQPTPIEGGEYSHLGYWRLERRAAEPGGVANAGQQPIRR